MCVCVCVCVCVWEVREKTEQSVLFVWEANASVLFMWETREMMETRGRRQMNEGDESLNEGE